MVQISNSKHASVVTTTEVEESTPLLAAPETAEQDLLYRTISSSRSCENAEQAETKPEEEKRSIFGVISMLLIGVFVSSADISLVMATSAEIASGFHKLEMGSWLLTSFGLASCVTQPMYGKLSDIFGRKSVLQTSYVIFALGTLACGLSRDMNQMITSRVIQGAGGAGMVSMVSILLADLVPLQDVAVYRSYVNIFATVGRSCGGLIGGLIAQLAGWRWAFLSQVPLIVLSIVLVWWKLEDPRLQTEDQTQTTWAKWKRIDFAGAFFMGLTILPIMLAFDISGRNLSWTSPILFGLLAVALASGVLFCLTEKYWAKEPIFPLSLLSHYVVVTSYLQIMIQIAIQTALIFMVPLYFQATKNASTGEAGAHLVPAIIGNTIGGLAAGAWIKRTGRYKVPTVLSSVFAMFCFTLLIILWRGNTNTAQSLIIFFGGLATGMAHSAIFVGLTAGIPKESVAIAASGLYLSSNIGAVVGISAAGAIFQDALRWRLEMLLSRESDGSDIIRKVLSDVGFLSTLHGRIHDAVVGVFVESIQQTYRVALVFAAVALVVGLASRQTKILH